MRMIHSTVLAFIGPLAASCMVANDDLASVSDSAGVTGPALYVDGETYRTVGTPTDLPATAPASSFDTIYDLGGMQLNVADAAPGTPGFNGGRWEVHAIEFTDYDAALATYDANDSGAFDSASEIEAALAGGAAIDLGVVKRFECPVIRL